MTGLIPTIEVYAQIIGRVLGLNGIQDARSTLFMQCAWHMHHSQPNKYPLSIVEEENVLELFQQFVIEYGN